MGGKEEKEAKLSSRQGLEWEKYKVIKNPQKKKQNRVFGGTVGLE